MLWLVHVIAMSCPKACCLELNLTSALQAVLYTCLLIDLGSSCSLELSCLVQQAPQMSQLLKCASVVMYTYKAGCL